MLIFLSMRHVGTMAILRLSGAIAPQDGSTEKHITVMNKVPVDVVVFKQWVLAGRFVDFITFSVYYVSSMNEDLRILHF
jgi:hypothetical protein